MKNPILSNKRNIQIYFFVWTAIISGHTKILYFFYNVDLWYALLDGIVYNLLFAGMAMSFWYSVRYLSIYKRDRFSVIINHVVTGFIFIGIWLLTGFYLLKILTEFNPSYQDFLKHSFPMRFIIGVFYYIVIILLYYLYIYYASFKEKLIKEAELNTVVKETQLSLLKSQLNPHFIFNSLNSISSLTITNPSMAQDMVIKLSSFLRYALDQSKNQLIPFTEELENSLIYLDIEETRFKDRLQFNKEIDEACKNWKLPNMILQPLLENAIKHGVCENLQPVIVGLSAQSENNYLHIKISNTFDSEAIIKKGKGIGLKNVKERLYLIYGASDLMKISQSNNLFEVNLYIPQS